VGQRVQWIADAFKQLWAQKDIANLDCLLLPPELKLHTFMSRLRQWEPVTSKGLRLVFGIREVLHVEDAKIGSLYLKRDIVNQALSYQICLENIFNVSPKNEEIYFPNATLRKADFMTRDFISSTFGGRPFVVVYAATWGPREAMRRDIPPWLLDVLVEWARLRGIALILVGQKDHGPQIPTSLSLNSVDFRGKRSFLELMGLFRASRLVFAMDGGLLHLALASQAPTVSFWGPTLPESRVVSNHPFHFPMCKYLPFQPYFGDQIPDSEAIQRTKAAFDFDLSAVSQVAERAMAAIHPLPL
jgi:hypothetical protein